MSTQEPVLPVFIRNNDIARTALNPATVLEVCLAAERISGRGSIIGAQDIRGLWRIYPANRDSRNTLLIQGIALRGMTIKVCATNPYTLRDNAGEETPSTKVWIDDIPISVADSEIEFSLVKLGCELRSAVKMERARDADNKLTRFLTGRRFVFITTPTTPLEKTMKVGGFFTAKVYHREQKLVKKKVICSKCLNEGHHVSQCDREVVCRDCLKPGHKRGDNACSARASETEGDSDTEIEPNQSGELTTAPNETRAARSDNAQAANPAAKLTSEKDREEEGGETRTPRPSVRQTAIHSHYTSDSRSRSESSKRRRSSQEEGGKSGGKILEKLEKKPRHERNSLTAHDSANNPSNTQE